MDAAYVDALNQNREIRAENRVKYLELTGLFKLDSTSNTFGKAASNNFVLAIENLAETIGSIDLSEEALTFYATKDIKVTNALGEEINTLTLTIDTNGKLNTAFSQAVKMASDYPIRRIISESLGFKKPCHSSLQRI